MKVCPSIFVQRCLLLIVRLHLSLDVQDITPYLPRVVLGYKVLSRLSCLFYRLHSWMSCCFEKPSPRIYDPLSKRQLDNLKIINEASHLKIPFEKTAPFELMMLIWSTCTFFCCIQTTNEENQLQNYWVVILYLHGKLAEGVTCFFTRNIFSPSIESFLAFLWFQHGNFLNTFLARIFEFV